MSDSPKPRKAGLRREEIAEAILSNGSGTAQDLAVSFGVSLNTIHRDLDELERQGVVRKFHGGVSAQPSGIFESNVAYRLKRMLPEKRLVAEHAVRFVQPGMSVMLDDSTTALQLVPLLNKIAPLHVVTNYLEVIRQLTASRDIRLIALGGEYDPQHDAFTGVKCVECIQSIRVDVAFTSTSAISATTAYHQEERVVVVKRAMLQSAAKRYLLVDHSKLGTVALHRLVPLSEFDLIIVDRGARESALADLDQNRVKYQIAGA